MSIKPVRNYCRIAVSCGSRYRIDASGDDEQLIVSARLPQSRLLLYSGKPDDTPVEDRIEALTAGVEVIRCTTAGCGNEVLILAGQNSSRLCTPCRAAEPAPLSRHDMRRLMQGRPYRIDICYENEDGPVETESFYTCFKPSEAALTELARRLANSGACAVTVTDL